MANLITQEIPGLLLREEKGSALSFQEVDDNFRFCATYAYDKNTVDDKISQIKPDLLKIIFCTKPDGYQPIANLFFGPAGDDSNTGLTEHPKDQLKTLQQAFIRLTQFFFPVAPFGLIPSPGSYAGGTLVRSVPSYVTIQGDISLPTNFNFTGTMEQPAFNIENVNFEIVGCQLTGDFMLNAGMNSRINLKNCVFDGRFEYGLVADGGKIFIEEGNVWRNNLNSGIALYAKNQGAIYLNQPMEIQGLAEIQTFALAEHNSEIRVGSTITGNPSVGKRFVVRTNSLISTSGRGLNFFPGSIDGDIDSVTGGIYE